MARIVILGAGMMGSALAVPLVDRGHDVELVGTHLDVAIVESLRARSFHPTLKLDLPRTVRASFDRDFDRAMEGADALALGVSSAGIAWAAEKIAPFVRPELPVFLITKGLALRDGALTVLPDDLVLRMPKAKQDGFFPAAIAGPCIAGELARRVPTCVVVTGRDRGVLDRVASLARGEYYHLVPSLDVVGVATCAALKNAYAMGIAFAAGMHEAKGGAPGSVAMHNVESACFAQSIFEMQKIIAALDGDVSSAALLPGAGDLDVTTNGGRTGRFGKWLGTGLSVDEAIAKMEGATLECLEILRAMDDALPALESSGKLRRSDVPLLDHMIDVVRHGAKANPPLARFFGAA